MAWKRLTFVLIPHSKEKIRQIGIHRNVLYAMAVFLIAATGIMIFYIIGFKGKSFYLSQTRDLVNKNNILMEHLALFDSSLAVMSTQITQLESVNKSIIEESEISDMDLKLLGDIKMGFSEKSLKLLPRRVLAIINRLDRESEAFEHNFNALYEQCMNNIDFVEHVPSIRPTDGVISREFGLSFDYFSKMEKKFTGVNIHNVKGTPVVSTADGVVEQIDDSDELGHYIIVDHQNGYTTRYAHLQTIPQMKKKISIKKGDNVKRGQQIGAMGRTGESISVVASHLTYSVYHNGVPVNPTDYFFASDFTASYQEESSEAQRREPHPE